MGLVSITRKNLKKYIDGILSIESGAEYSLGEDYFHIDHGKNYLEFFDRLGKVHYLAWAEKSRMAAVGAGIIRSVPTSNGFKKSWYLCDLKVHPDFRGMRIPLRMMGRAFPLKYLICQRAYAISMDPANNEINRITKLLKKFFWLPFQASGKILFWSLNEEEMSRVLPLVERHRGKVSFLSLNGIKDIILKSTGKPLKLLHAQFGPMAVHGNAKPEPKATHMFCALESDPLAQEVQKIFTHSATATIISHRMKDNDWKWVLTSDI